MLQKEKQVRTKKKIAHPKQYAVIMHNDDYTPMEFVVDILRLYFDKDLVEATATMWKVHTEGWAVCGVYPKEIAETRVEMVHEEAKKQGYPLRCSLRPEGRDDE